jgi:hypothetical protein
MSPLELFQKLRALGVELSIDGDGRLAYDGPADVLGAELLAEMRAHRDELVRLSSELPRKTCLTNPTLPTYAIPSLICPWCRCGDRLIDADDGLSCGRCGRLAFRFLDDGSIERVDYVEMMVFA